MLDILVIGAGPCGISVGAAAAQAGLDALLVDRGCITHSLIDYPYYMTFFSTAAKLEVGGIPFTIPESNPTRRQALAYYRRVVEAHGIRVNQYEEILSVKDAGGDGFVALGRARSGEETRYRSRALVVATGGFHEPNWLDVPGERSEKVLHYYKEPYPFYDQDVLVVGGGNSAVESALELFRNGTRVSLVHFAEGIDRGVKPWVVPDITNRLQKGEIPSWFGHRIASIGDDSVVLRDESNGATTEIANDWVLAMTGWRSNPAILKSLEVPIDAHTGIPEHDPATMETPRSGVFIAGVLAAGNNANKIFIENGREHGGRIVDALMESWGANEGVGVG